MSAMKSNEVMLPDGIVVPVVGSFYRTTDGVIVARTEYIVYAFESLDGYTQWSGKVVPIKYGTWLNKSDSEWAGNPSIETKRNCPDGRWGCYSSPEAALAAAARHQAKAKGVKP